MIMTILVASKSRVKTLQNHDVIRLMKIILKRVKLILSIGNFLNSGIDQFLAFSNALNKEYIEVLDLYVYNLGIGSGQISFSVAVGVMKSIIALILFGLANTASKKIRGTSVF